MFPTVAEHHRNRKELHQSQKPWKAEGIPTKGSEWEPFVTVAAQPMSASQRVAKGFANIRPSEKSGE